MAHLHGADRDRLSSQVVRPGHGGRDGTMAGEELLIADATERDREGLRRHFESAGYICTGAPDRAAARDLVQRKFFPVALVDMDFEGPNGGLELIRFMHQHSPPTKVVMMAGRRSFETAVEAMRLGVIDIVNKRPDQMQHLSASIGRAMDRYHAGSKDSTLLREVKSVLDDSFKILLGMCRKVYGQPSSGGSLNIKPAILVIDEDQNFLQELAKELEGRPWEISVEMSGGSGLDKACTFSFQIIAVREELMDLPGQMLLRSAQAQQQNTLGLLYSGRGAGLMQRYERGQPSAEESPFEGARHLVRRLEGLVEEISTMREERRYMQAFRAEHGPFLKRFAELKVRIDSLTK